MVLLCDLSGIGSCTYATPLLLAFTTTLRDFENQRYALALRGPTFKGLSTFKLTPWWKSTQFIERRRRPLTLSSFNRLYFSAVAAPQSELHRCVSQNALREYIGCFGQFSQCYFRNVSYI